MAPGGGNKDNQCLACGKQCTSQQFSVQCTLCSLWCHRDCGGISEAYFKALDLQMREMGTAFWACPSCMSFATKVNNQFKDMDRRIGEVGAKTEAVTKKVEEHTAEIGEVRGDMRKLEEKLEEMEKKLEDRMCEEMREREIRRLNLVLHRVEEPSQRIRDGRERMEADKKACVKIFKAMKVPSSSEDIRFCRRIGEKGDEPRPLLNTHRCEDRGGEEEFTGEGQRLDEDGIQRGGNWSGHDNETETRGEENEGRSGQEEQGGPD
jgi:hypothetical protein